MDSDIDGIYTDTVSGENNNHRVKAYRTSLLSEAINNWELSFTADHSDVSSDAALAEPTYGESFPILLVRPNDPRLPDIISEGQADEFSNAYFDPGFVTRSSTQLAFKAKRLSNEVALTSITSINREELQERLDFDASILDVAFQDVDQESTQTSQELRLSSVEDGWGTLDGQLKWVTGIYYFEDDAERSDSTPFGLDNIQHPINFNGIPTVEYLVNIDTKSYALYGQSTYHVSDQTNLTLGIRYTRDEKDYSYLARSNNSAPPVTENFDIFDTLTFESLDPKISIDHHFSDAVMAYASVSQGFKSGGVQFGIGDPELAEKAFDEERLTSYEIGIKGRYWDQRLQINSALYHYDYKDQQMQGFVNVNGFPNALTENAGQSRMTGLEIESLILLSQSLTLDLKYTWQDATFDEFDAFAGDVSGNDMPFAPKHSATTNLRFQSPISDKGTIGLQLGLAYKDDFFFDYLNSNNGYQESYSVVNLSSWWDSMDTKLRLRLFCQNCTDKSYRLNYVAFPEPFDGGRNISDYGRRYGLEFSYYFQ